MPYGQACGQAEERMRYVLDHWRGKQGFAWSFWVNLVALRAALFLAQELLAPAEDADYHRIAIPVLILSFFVNGPLLVWQIVGVLRAGEIHLADTGSQAQVWGAQASMVFLIFLSLGYALQSWQFTRERVIRESYFITFERERRSRYSVEVGDGVLHFAGPIELGATARVREVLADHPDVWRVILESDGGNIYEGRGLAQLFGERRLATHVEGRCSSACTIAFSGGAARSIAPGGRLGFHQYRVDAGYEVVIANPADEQARDLERFRKAGFSEAFLARVFASRPGEMWFPEVDELVAAGVVQAVTKDASR